jgi:hypothetical protein
MIYLATRGVYSDYTVLGVFSTREKADAYAAWMDGPEPDQGSCMDEVEIEEFPLDQLVPTDTGAFEAGIAVFRVDAEPQPYWTRTGREQFVWWNPEAVVAPPVIKPQRFFISTTIPGATQCVTVVGTGPTSEHARRSADELARAIVAGTVIPPEPE